MFKLVDLILNFFRNNFFVLKNTQTPSSIDNQRFIQMIYILTDLIVFIFAFALKTMSIDNDISQEIPSTRILPDSTSSEFYQLHAILSPNSEKLVNHYDQCAIRGEFPFTEQFHTYLDDL